MQRQHQIRKLIIGLCAVLALGVTALAKKGERALDCSNNNWNNDRGHSCRMQEFNLPASGGVLDVDGRGNGGISVKGWDKNETFVRAQIQSWAKTDAEAQALNEQVRVVINGTTIRGDGPRTQNNTGWAVSYEIFAPRRSDLLLKASNGGISIAEIRGNINFDTVNGGVTLRGLAGNVRGETTNGGVTVDLDGARWDGEGLDVKTTNGGVKVTLADGYNAHLEARTVNGGMNFDFPVTVVGKIDRELNTNLGAGGAPIRIQTTNGGVSLKRK